MMEMNKRNETAEMLVKFYNMQFGENRWSNDKNKSIVLEALDRAGEDVQAIKDHIREQAKLPRPQRTSEKERLFETTFESFTAVKPEPVVAPTVQPTEQAVGSAMDLLGQAVVGLIAKKTGEVRWSDIEKDMYFLNFSAPKAKGCQIARSSQETAAKYKGMTMKEYLRYLWNIPKNSQSPYHLFEKVLIPNGLDENGDIIYKYNESVTFEPCKQIDRKEVDELRV